MGETLPIAPGESSMTFGQGVGCDGLTTRSYLQIEDFGKNLRRGVCDVKISELKSIDDTNDHMLLLQKCS
jgi:hypothetical protein